MKLMNKLRKREGNKKKSLVFGIVFAILIIGGLAIATTTISDTGVTTPEINIGSDGTSTALIYLNQTDSNSNGIFISSEATELTRDVIRINSKNGARGIFIDQDGGGGSLLIDSESVSNTTFNIDAVNTVLSTAKITNAGASTSGAVLGIFATSSSHNGNGLAVDYDGTGSAMVIESESTINPAFSIDQSKYGMSVQTLVNGGYAGFFKSAVTSTVSASSGLVRMIIQNPSDTSPILVLDNLGSGVPLLIKNMTTPTCNSANAGGIFYNGTPDFKHYGCNSTEWNALY